MSEIAINADRLSKPYRLGEIQWENASECVRCTGGRRRKSSEH
jgi:hypothetical protein